MRSRAHFVGLLACLSPAPFSQFARPSSTATLDSDRFAFPKEAAGAGAGAAGAALKDAGPKNFTKQYAAIYFSRLRALKPAVLAQAQKGLPSFSHAPFVAADGSLPPVCARILDMVPDQWCVIAGTLYKDMKLKPSILEEYAKTSGHAVSTTADGSVYVSEDDTLILEDEQGRVQLTGTADKLNVAKLVSGVVVSVLGKEVAGGKFDVHALWTPEMSPQKPMPAAMKEQRAPAYMLVVSGLSLGQPGVDPTPVQMLMDYATGLLGSTAEQRSSASIVRVMIAGNALHRYDKRRATGAGSASANKAAARDFGREDTEHDDSVAPLRELDLLLTPLAASVPVDIFPGESDPSNFTLPQQPFHKCLFPSASSFSTFTRTTNPCWLEVEGLQVLATAGQNVSDLAKYSTAANCEVG